MQADLPADAHIIGVNEVGHEHKNEDFCEGRDLPWLQDTVDVDVWNTWSVTYRDVIVLDREGAFAGVYNLSDQDLGEADNYQALLQLISQTAADNVE